jgi:hypothetical protein
MKGLREFINIIETVHSFKTKGTGPISVILGMDFSCDDDNTLCISPLQYIEKLVKTYEHMFGEHPKEDATSPWKKGTILSYILQSCWKLKEYRCINLWLMHGIGLQQ